MTKPKVLIGLPTMGSIHTLLAVVLMGWLADAHQQGDINLGVYPTMYVSPVDNARNEIVETFLSDPSYTHLFFIDSDTIPPKNALRDLLSHDKDIISGITPIIEHDENRKNDSNGFYKKWNCVDQQDQFVKPNTGVFPIKGAGGSCILIKRKVFEKLEKPWYRFRYTDDSGKPVVVGEDIHFIIKAIAAGFRPYVDTSVIAQHNKTILW